MKFTKLAMGAAVATAMLAGPVLAGSHGGTTTLRIQTHYAADHPTGLIYQEWVAAICARSGSKSRTVGF